MCGRQQTTSCHQTTPCPRCACCWSWSRAWSKAPHPTPRARWGCGNHKVIDSICGRAENLGWHGECRNTGMDGTPSRLHLGRCLICWPYWGYLVAILWSSWLMDTHAHSSKHVLTRAYASYFRSHLAILWPSCGHHVAILWSSWLMDTHIHRYTHTRMHIYTDTHTHKHIYTYTHIHTHTHTQHTYKGTLMCANTLGHVRMHAHTHTYVHTRIYI